MIKIKIPASTANLGSGFDSIGAALDLYNIVSAEEYDGCDISSSDGSSVPNDEENLIYKSAKKLYEICGKPFYGLKIIETNNIPMARGLGSSSACIVGGLAAANELCKRPLNKDELLGIAAETEGHPDNVAPALLGGLTVCAMENEKVFYTKCELKSELKFCAFVPDFELKTADARAVLPKETGLGDAVFNISRAALLASSFALGKYENFREGTKDRLHQPFRLPLIPGSENIINSSLENGARASYISGAGSTIMAIYKGNHEEAEKFAQKILSDEYPNWKAFILEADNSGAESFTD